MNEQIEIKYREPKEIRKKVQPEPEKEIKTKV